MAMTSIDEALRRVRRGEMVLVADDEDRENEGDLTMAAEWVTPESINFMLRWARGLVCMPCHGDRLDELEVGPMVPSGSATTDTPFAVTIDHRARGQRHRCGRPRADHSARARSRLAPERLPASRPRVPAAGPAWRCARASWPHRGRGRSRGPRRLRADRGDLRGVARRRFTGACAVPRALRAGAPHRDDLGLADRRAPPDARRPRRERVGTATSSVTPAPARVDASARAVIRCANANP